MIVRCIHNGLLKTDCICLLVSVTKVRSKLIIGEQQQTSDNVGCIPGISIKTKFIFTKPNRNCKFVF